jgi:N-acetylmuramoyl-L-alanine amidase
MYRLRPRSVLLVAVLFLPATAPRAQTPPAAPLTLVSSDGSRQIATTLLNNQELLALDELATHFPVAVKDDAAAGGVTLTYRGRIVVVAANQATASVGGRVVALPSPVVRSGRRWLVPIEFLQIALGPIYDQRIQVRRGARLVLVGNVRVPRVTTRLDGVGTPTRVSIDISPASPVSTRQDGARVLVRVDADALDLAPLPAGAGLVQQVRPSDQPNTIVVTLDPAAGAARIATTTTDTAARVTIEVALAALPEPAAPAAPGSPPAGPPVDRASLLSPRPVLQTVVLDPGHGGPDVGVTGAAGVEEKQVTLDVARRLRTLLETRLGLRVLLTRGDDSDVEMDRRAAVANNAKADLFVSLHANGAPVPSTSGAEVYYLQLDREGEAVRQQADAAMAVPVVGGGTRRIEILRWDLAQARHVETSATLAAIVAESLAGRVPMGASPVRRAPLRVLEGLNMPAVLVEMAYLTNPAQERLSRSDEYRNDVAQALLDALVTFRRYLEDQARP